LLRKHKLFHMRCLFFPGLLCGSAGFGCNAADNPHATVNTGF
jgi:hypothetical protein